MPPDYRSVSGVCSKQPSKNTAGIYKNRYEDSYDSRDGGYTDEYDSEDFDVEYFDSDDYEDDDYDIDDGYGRRSRSDYRIMIISMRVTAGVHAMIIWMMIMTAARAEATGMLPGGAEKMQARTYPVCSLLSKKRRNTEQKGSIVLPVP